VTPARKASGVDDGALGRLEPGELVIDRLLNNRIPIFVKIMTPLVLVIVATVAVSGYLVYRDGSQRLQLDLDRRLERAAVIVTDIVSRERLHAIQQPDDVDSTAYAEVRQLLQYACNAANLDWVGIYYREQDRLYYWVDVDATGVGYPFLNATPQHMAVFADSQPRYVRYVDEYGAFYGYVVPIVETTDSGRQVIGVVEASVDQASRTLIGLTTLRQVVPNLVGGMVAAIGLTVLITYFLFSRPLRRLQQGAHTLASGYLGHVIDLHSRDELGDLAAAFNQMSVRIETLYRERVEIERLQREWEIRRWQETGRLLEAKVTERTAELARRNEQLMRSQVELAEARDQALAASRAKSVFLANISHELRTPLNAIIGYSEMLQEDAQELGCAQMVPDLTKIQAAGQHLLELINDMLDLSKIEAGKMELYLEDFEAPALIESVVATIQPLIEKNGNVLQVACAPDVRSMRADLTKVRQVLFNLLSNAAKFTESGTVQLLVDHDVPAFAPAEMRNPSLWVRWRVVDTGIGIASGQLERIFQAFTQGDASTTRKFGGTGLGLAISIRYCRMMGGDILVESEVGRGSSFSAYLPTGTGDSTIKSAPPSEGESPATQPRPSGE
jgi:signal transduction histidine kinase